MVRRLLAGLSIFAGACEGSGSQTAAAAGSRARPDRRRVRIRSICVAGRPDRPGRALHGLEGRLHPCAARRLAPKGAGPWPVVVMLHGLGADLRPRHRAPLRRRSRRRHGLRPPRGNQAGGPRGLRPRGDLRRGLKGTGATAPEDSGAVRLRSRARRRPLLGHVLGQGPRTHAARDAVAERRRRATPSEGEIPPSGAGRLEKFARPVRRAHEGGGYEAQPHRRPHALELRELL
jgi:hypothetical protein